MSPSQKEAISAAPKDPPYTVRLKRGTAKGLLDAPEHEKAPYNKERYR